MPIAQNSKPERAAETSRLGATTGRPAGRRPPLHVLLLEDRVEDVNAIVHELRRGYEPIALHVTTREELLDALKEGTWQIVLLDYSIEGGGTALQSLAALAELDIDLPTILISGPIGEEEAADALRAGANDFVNKDNLIRLVPAIARELEEVETRRQQVESAKALKQTGDRMQLALDPGGMASWEWDPTLGWRAWSHRLEALFGLEPGEFRGTYEELLDRVHPDDRTLFGASVEETITRNSPDVVYRAVWPDESVHWHERKSRQVVDTDGKFRGVAGVTFDVTEREEAAAALRESEERFRLIAEHAHDLIALLDGDGRFSYVSPSCGPMLGYSTEELEGTVARDLIHPDDRPGGLSLRALRDVRLERADGSWVWVEGRSYEIEGRSGSHSAVIARDISERKRAETERLLLENELRQAQKMEAIGQLAGGIAHDFSNLLTVISGYTEILLSRPVQEQADRTREILEIKRAAHRATRLIRQLLAFSRQQVIEPRVLDLTGIVRETQTMFAPLVGENIEFETDLAGDLGSVTADAGQIEQVIMNLVVNARDAMPDGGTVRVTTANVTLAEDAAERRPDTPPGDYVVLAVTDSGHGMDAETAGRIFEPFFTTKERGAGTGLGLSTVYGIARQFGGDIEVESEPGVGTTFRLYFPRVSAAPEVFRPQPVDDDRSLRGTETVLLVEDEEALRSIGKEMLESYGYTVILAGDGAEALEIARDDGKSIQVLMTDILMPKMGGIELADELSALHSDLKIVYTSGYNDRGADLRRVAGSRYLQKPYSMQHLARTLRDLLDPIRAA